VDFVLHNLVEPLGAMKDWQNTRCDAQLENVSKSSLNFALWSATLILNGIDEYVLDCR
jgi:hypothetical protein